MKDKQWSRFFTEAGIISLIVVYSYTVYLFGELGALNALGLNGLTALITLDIQNILLGFLRSLMYFICFIIIVIILSLPALKAEPNSKKELRWKKLSFCVLALITLAAYSPIIYSETGMFGLTTISLFIVVALLTFMTRLPGRKESIEKTYENFLKRILFSNKKLPRSVRIILPSIILSLILIPFLNFLISYNSVAIQPSRTIEKVTTINESTYWVARTYSDKYVLVKLRQDEVTPSYLIVDKDHVNNLEFALQEINIDNQKLHPQTKVYQRMNQMIQNFLRF